MVMVEMVVMVVVDGETNGPTRHLNVD